ncbi:MAG TPA: hypothetical protein VF077_00575 [Nitrospiraceae bacterium]
METNSAIDNAVNTATQTADNSQVDPGQENNQTDGQQTDPQLVPGATAMMTANAKAPRVAKATVRVEGQILIFTFANKAVLQADYSLLTDDLKLKAGMHGLEQRIRDTYAGAKTPDEAEGLARKVWDVLSVEKAWSVKSEGSAEDSIDMLVQAMTIAYANEGKALPENLKARLTAADRGTRASIRAYPSVAVELAKLRTANSQAKSLDDLKF